MSYDPCASRSIQPLRHASPTFRPVVAIDGTTVVSERTGQSVTVAEYNADLLLCPPSLVVTYSPEVLLYQLHERWENHPRWTWRVAVTTKHGRPLLHKRVAYYGFKRESHKGKGTYHLIIDANSFFRTHDKGISDLLAFGVELRNWCNEHGLTLRTSAAGVATQLLRHPDFYPEPRRRVPTFINDEARKHVPGNHYDCFADIFQHHNACTYVDQQAAFHYAVSQTPLPNGNSVLAHGYTRKQDKPWARAGGKLYEHARQKHGLIRAMVNVPMATKDRIRFAPALMHEHGRHIAHLWTNEIPYLESLGLSIEYIVAAWGTKEVDTGIKLYAEWAQREQVNHPWLKGLLLMPYGLLARRTRDVTLHHPGGDEPLLIGNQLIPNTRTRLVHAMPETANVLQLGLIQSYVRALSLDMARQLDTDKHEVLSIYADGIFVRASNGDQLPLMAPWRVKEEYAQIEIADAMRFPGSRRFRERWTRYCNANNGGNGNANERP